MPKYDFKKVALQLYSNQLWHGSSPVNFRIFSQHLFLRTPLGGCFCLVLMQVLNLEK